MRVVVVGGGVAGLSAALEVRHLRPDADVVVLESSSRLGGKVAVSEVGGLPVDEGADAMLTRVPDGLALARGAGLEDELVSPASGQAAVWSRGALRPLPAGTLLGVPTDLAALARSELLSSRGLWRTALDLALPGGPVEQDVSVGDLVRRRMGREVVERLVDPLLGGVYAGRADLLSLRATLPQLVAAAARQRSLLLAARETRAGAPPADGPLFAGLPGGLGRLPAAVAAAAGADVRLRTTVRELRRRPDGWALTTGSAAHPRLERADAVVLAVPGPPASRLLAGVVPTAAAEVGTLEYASVAIVTLVLAGPTPGAGSGYLVPAAEGRTTKAVTFTSRKWSHYAAGPAVVRASVGRFGDTADLQRPDAELVAAVLAELRQAVGPLPVVAADRVVRWGGGLPQYAVGHLDRVRRIRAAVAQQPGLAVAGAAYDGVGVPAVAGSGRAAARSALASALRQNGAHEQSGHRDPA